MDIRFVTQFVLASKCEAYRTVSEIRNGKVEYIIGNLILLGMMFGIRNIKFVPEGHSSAGLIAAIMSIVSMSVIGISGAVPREFLIDCARGSLGRIFASPIGFDVILLARHLINTMHSYIAIACLSLILALLGAIPAEAIIQYFFLFPLVLIYSFVFSVLFVSVALLTKSEKITQISSFFLAACLIFLPAEHFIGRSALYVPFSGFFVYLRTGDFISARHIDWWIGIYGLACSALTWAYLKWIISNLKLSGKLLHKEA